ncbi:hypothetical protein KAR91_50040 [Candidatus Pacearchaeota archaeon]|nr:hypothetical protein [Candidatus Pacearchaeota archaeon]
MAEQQEITRNLDKILWGKSIVTIDGRFTDEATMVLRSLTIAESNFINHIYERELRAGLDVGILTDEELEQFYENNQVWTAADEAEIRVLTKQIDLLKSQIMDAEFFPVKQKQLRKKLLSNEDKIRDKKRVKSQLFNCSVETRAMEISRRFMVMMSTESLKGIPMWETEVEFMNECDIDLIYNLALAYYNCNIFPETELREMARSGQWRFKWNASKNGIDLFGKPISEWSEMQDALVYWSQFYDYVFECPERPSQLVIDDDDACDAWVNDQLKSKRLGQTKEKRNSVQSTQRKGKTTGARHEQFVMVQPGDVDTVQRVQEMNPNDVRRKLQAEQDKIQKSGKRLTEWQLRGKEYLQTLDGGK